MSHIQVFDPALCCSTGVCGTDVDQALVTFAADVEWARQQGAAIDRFNLAQEPTAFATNPAVLQAARTLGSEGPARWCWWTARWPWPGGTRSAQSWRSGPV